MKARCSFWRLERSFSGTNSCYSFEFFLNDYFRFNYTHLVIVVSQLSCIIDGPMDYIVCDDCDTLLLNPSMEIMKFKSTGSILNSLSFASLIICLTVTH